MLISLFRLCRFFMSGFYTQLTEHVAAFAVIYGVFLSFGEAGPGDCLGLLASKTWPTAARGQMCESACSAHPLSLLALVERLWMHKTLAVPRRHPGDGPQWRERPEALLPRF